KRSETIVTSSEANARKFLRLVDSAAVYWNASTRFTDGGEFGFGAEMGVSTQKLHCRGPFALKELTSTKYQIIGTGQTRQRRLIRTFGPGLAVDVRDELTRVAARSRQPACARLP